MNDSQPRFSILIPTYNRAEILEYCLDHLRAFERLGVAFEIVVSDNASTDTTGELIAARLTTTPYLRYFRQQKNVGGFPNWLNAMRQAKAPVLVYLADDDTLLPEQTIKYVERFEREPDLAALYADVIAWDDDAEQELHRYYKFPSPQSFGPESPLDLINFIFHNIIYPEVGIFRRNVCIDAFTFVDHCLPFHYWMYRMSRQGRVAFELAPYFREHRVLKKKFSRGHWLNMEKQIHYIGDELRNSLENLLLSALQDSNMPRVPDDQQFQVRKMIEGFLHGRTWLEIQRAIGRKNWILAWELRRRLALWYGPGDEAVQIRDFQQITMPAALQSVQDTLTSMTGIQALCLNGFKSDQIESFFRGNYPETQLQKANSNGPESLILCKYSAESRHLASQGVPMGALLSFEHLLDQYRVGKINIDLSAL